MPLHEWGKVMARIVVLYNMRFEVSQPSILNRSKITPSQQHLQDRWKKPQGPGEIPSSQPSSGRKRDQAEVQQLCTNTACCAIVTWNSFRRSVGYCVTLNKEGCINYFIWTQKTGTNNKTIKFAAIASAIWPRCACLLPLLLPHRFDKVFIYLLMLAC